MEPLRGDDRAVRQGPGHRRRIARPIGRDRRARSTSASRRCGSTTSSSTSAAGRCRPRRGAGRPPTRSPRSSRPSSCASSSCGRGRTTPSTGSRRAPTRSRASSTSSTASPRPRAGEEVKGELPPDHDRVFAAALLDPGRRPGGGGPPVPAPVRPPGAPAAGSRRGGRGAPHRREGRTAHRPRARDPRRAGAARPGAGWRTTRRSGPDSRCRRDGLPDGAADLDARPARGARRPGGRGRKRHLGRRGGAGRDLRGSPRTRAARRPPVRRAVPGIPRPAPRAACRLAARQPRSRHSSWNGSARRRRRILSRG